jgi:hypothetical protein
MPLAMLKLQALDAEKSSQGEVYVSPDSITRIEKGPNSKALVWVHGKAGPITVRETVKQVLILRSMAWESNAPVVQVKSGEFEEEHFES